MSKSTRLSGEATEPDPEESVLEIDELEAAYGPTQVLHGISLTVEQGEIVSLIGRNGAGKTTTLNAVLGNVDVVGGRITFKREGLTYLSPEQTVRRGVSLIPEERRIFGNLTVRENLRLGSMGGSSEGLTRSIDEVLDMFENLKQAEHSKGKALSGGEQQMLAIGRALVSGTDFLMLDEPTEGLAPIIVDRVEELITDLNEEGLTIILVEQNAEVAMNVGHRHYILDNGEVVYHGDTPDLEANEDIMERYLGVTV
jgi:branched-chain amino acid transport system ATP-binding protein